MKVVLLLALLWGVASAEEGTGKPETTWLKADLLEKWVREFGYKVENSDENRILMRLQVESGNLVFVEFSDNDSLKMMTSWDSDQTGLGDGPIVNGWNNERRFCKVSISDKPEEQKGTLMVMHLDQLLPTKAGAESTRLMTKKTLELFETGVVEFDQFSKDTYKQWQRQQKPADDKEVESSQY